MNRSDILADAINSCRELTWFYGSEFNDDNCLLRPVEGCNCALWLLGHLAVCENDLVLAACGGQPVDVPWAAEFQLGASGEESDSWPGLADVHETIGRVHPAAVGFIRSLSEDALEAESRGPIRQYFPTVREVLIHAIRHEAYHAGQLAILARSMGVPRKI